MAMINGIQRSTYVFLFLSFTTLTTIVDLVSSDGYACNCDCGPNAGGGRCNLQLPSIEYLNSGGTCQAINLDNTRHQCVKTVATEDEAEDIMCWSMPRTACMCREPVGSYNLMCECDGNRGIFCGSEQNNCVCELLEADRNVAITIGIAVGTSVIGLFIITFIITAIYLIRRAQIERDPWYQFDKQFKQYMARKEREKAAGIKRPARKTVLAQPAAPTVPAPVKLNPSTIEDDATTSAEISESIKQPLVSPSIRAGLERPTNGNGRRASNSAGPNWLLADKSFEEQQAETELGSSLITTSTDEAASSSDYELIKIKPSQPSVATSSSSTTDVVLDPLNLYTASPGQSSENTIYSSSIMEHALPHHDGGAANVAPWSKLITNHGSDSVIVHQSATSMAFDNDIYASIE